MPSGACFVGSTPECLYTRTGTAVASEAVAGTRARGAGEPPPCRTPGLTAWQAVCMPVCQHECACPCVAPLPHLPPPPTPSPRVRLPGAGGDVERDFWLAFDLLRSQKDHVEFTVVRDWVAQVRREG